MAPSILREGQEPRPACLSCDFVLELNARVAVCTITTLEGGLILVRRGIEPKKGKWALPGGVVRRGETLPEAALRETRAEINLRVGLTGILDVYSSPGDDTVVAIYAADVLSPGPPEPGEEVLDVGVFAPESIPWEDLAFDTTRAALRDYLRRFFPRTRFPKVS